MRSSLAIILLLLITVKLSAQSDFVPGFIITNANDTINGLINYKGYKVNAQKCLFKTSVDREVTEYTPMDLLAYRMIDNKFYVKKFIDVEGTKTPVFLEYLVNGIIDFYYYRDMNGEYYYVENEEGTLILLKNDLREVFRNDTKYTAESNEYKHQLKLVFYQSPTTIDKVDDLNLSHKTLISIATNYHEEVCAGEECIVYEKKIQKAKKSYGLFGGVGVISLQTMATFPGVFDDGQFDPAIYPAFGFYFKTNVPEFDERFFIQGQIQYSYLKMKGSVVTPVSSLLYYDDIRYNTSILSGIFDLRYETTKDKIGFSFLCGLFYDLHVGYEYNRTTEVEFSSGNRYNQYEFNGNEYFTNSNYGFNIGIGIHGNIEKKAYFVDLSYQRGFGWSQLLDTNSLGLTVGIQLGGQR